MASMDAEPVWSYILWVNLLGGNNGVGWGIISVRSVSTEHEYITADVGV